MKAENLAKLEIVSACKAMQEAGDHPDDILYYAICAAYKAGEGNAVKEIAKLLSSSENKELVTIALGLFK